MGGFKEFVLLALPIMASQSCESVMIFTDRVFLSKLGSPEMNAATAGGIAQFTFITFFFGVIGFSTALIAQYFGAKKYDYCSRVTTQAFGVSFISYPIVILMIPLAHWYFESLGIMPEQLEAQKLYFNLLIYGSIISLLRHSLSCFFSGVGRTTIVMVSAIATILINVVVNYILIFGKFGMPAMGIEGAAIGSIISAFCGFLILLYYFLNSEFAPKFKTKLAFRFDKEIAQKLIKLGTPAGTEMFVNLIAFTVLVSLFHSYSAETATAASIAFNWDMVASIPLIGIEIGVASLVGRYIGANQKHVAERSAYTGVKVGFIFSLFMIILFVGFSEPLVNMFKPEGKDLIFDSAKPLAINMLRLISLYIFVESALMAFIGALRGAGDTLWCMWVSMALHWTLVPAVWISLYVFKMGPLFSWIVFVILFLLFCFVFYFRFRSRKWRNLEII